MNFLFWNINKKDLSESIYNIAKNHHIDVIILAESLIEPAQLLLTLNQDKELYFPNAPSLCEKVEIYTTFQSNFIAPIAETDRLSIRLLQLPKGYQTLLTALHFPDKKNHNNESQNELVGEYINIIKSVQKNNGIQSNIIVGDFNMNPFEKGMVKANGFHATMSKQIALEGSRKIQEDRYEYYYNPMWGLFGDLNSTPTGTYYYRKSELISYQWNIFDQVLVSPNLIDRFSPKKLLILETDGVNSLITKKHRPNKNTYSDHLPIIFSIDLN